MNSFYQPINLFFQVIESQRDARGRRCLESSVQRLGAVVACPDGYAAAIENSRYVVRVHACDDKRHDADSFARLANDAHA